MYRLATHFHTKESSPCGHIPAAEGVAAYAKAGFQGIVVTDHFSESVWGRPERWGGSGQQSWNALLEAYMSGWHAAAAAGHKLGLDIFLGLELRFPDNLNDFLVYGVTLPFLQQHPWCYNGSLEAFHDLAQVHDLLVVQAHPFRSMCHPANPAWLDGIEVYNGNPRHDSHNDRALTWAQQTGLLQTAGDDYHQTEDCLGAGLLFPKLEHLDAAELTGLLRQPEQYQLWLPGSAAADRVRTSVKP
ncbi:MAG: PHP domain-containing protein [Oscillospiraceae bacterium]|nr:PHP domain-containing protein [Oscillospiraceae bacterium]